MLFNPNDEIITSTNKNETAIDFGKQKPESRFEILKAQTSKRFIKTHLPFNLMPKNIKEVGAKVVYVARNPKDVVASYYHFQKVNPHYRFTGDFGSFLQYFMDDLGEFKSDIFNLNDRISKYSKS